MLSKSKLEQWFNKITHSQMEDRFCEAIAVAKKYQTRRLLFKLYLNAHTMYSGYHRRLAFEKLVGPLEDIEEMIEKMANEPFELPENFCDWDLE